MRTKKILLCLVAVLIVTSLIASPVFAARNTRRTRPSRNYRTMYNRPARRFDDRRDRRLVAKPANKPVAKVIPRTVKPYRTSSRPVLRNPRQASPVRRPATPRQNVRVVVYAPATRGRVIAWGTGFVTVGPFRGR
ncbi:MAG: hypothetical protein FWG10_09260 [Eubacteriaceae bacterium]|nr:hypothetical protein [Eubacteriaceae bacterium]